ncbi:MAG: hypothetical protein DWQ44_11490 [Bacteroidetes bacterium]|nr:MAG: hypothetical protein DWQ33_09610 [Bacteroidota bacterium]REK05244.1 MAG: hypothetical protein DWQ39_08620 [Bacteroidota bacterium]REK32649.1 MAG: hypothetical protein DWQ44_11490 [Bacteroidota bacterium]
MIENSKQLLDEIQRLEKVCCAKETVIKNRFTEIRENFSPAKVMINSFSSITGVDLNANTFLKRALLVAVTFFAQRWIRKKELSLESKIIEWVQKIFYQMKEKFSSGKDEHEEDDHSNESDPSAESEIPKA